MTKKKELRILVALNPADGFPQSADKVGCKTARRGVVVLGEEGAIARLGACRGAEVFQIGAGGLRVGVQRRVRARRKNGLTCPPPR